MTDSVRSVAPHAGLLCPVCRVDLVMSERQGIEIDYCPKCRGVWLDRGELDKIVERSAAEVPSAAPQGSQRLGREEQGADGGGRHGSGHGEGHGGGGHGGGYRRKRSFLSDLFD